MHNLSGNSIPRIPFGVKQFAVIFVASKCEKGGEGKKAANFLARWRWKCFSLSLLSSV
jgi:hypothetical protein